MNQGDHIVYSPLPQQAWMIGQTFDTLLFITEVKYGQRNNGNGQKKEQMKHKIITNWYSRKKKRKLLFLTSSILLTQMVLKESGNLNPLLMVHTHSMEHIKA